MKTEETSKAARIHAGLKHPVIDSDGHIVESQPAAMTYLAEIAGQSAVDRYHAWQSRLAPTREQQRDERLMRLLSAAMLEADLRRKGVDLQVAADPLTDSAFIAALSNAYPRSPTIFPEL